ncbi:hypothetical protein AK812_SmicGene32562 [Symbiodinium microadriaticum]|uniref:Uncharacterized protein n=1 Tax=Symbiodinium microadriaticum TaxID=2951 RepID=A0A1Q9CTS5_SYMMI|nr:hypothetical protein AK812_SmicGene32562 [Symbiodinium microadriaticum]
MDVDETHELASRTGAGPLLYHELTSWQSLPVAARHQVLLVELGAGGLRAGGNEGYEAGLRDGLGDSDGAGVSPSLALTVFAAKATAQYNDLGPDPDMESVVAEDKGDGQRPIGNKVRAAVEKAQLTASPEALAECLDRFDVGLVPRLFRLGISQKERVPEILSLVVFLIELLPEIGAEVFRNHLHLLWYLGKTGLPQEEAAVAAALREFWGNLIPAGVLASEDDSWMGFCGAHYVIRFSPEPCAVPAGGAPPPAVLRVAAYGCLGDAVQACRGREDAEKARELLGYPLAGQVVLELGCGVGIAGITAASFASGCILTDVEPTVLEAAALNLRYTGGAASNGRVELLDFRNVEAVHSLALSCGVTVVIAADILYGAVSQQEVAQAVRASLPNGGSALLLMPVHYRPGMDKDSLGQALLAAGLETLSVLEAFAVSASSVGAKAMAAFLSDFKESEESEQEAEAEEAEAEAEEEE